MSERSTGRPTETTTRRLWNRLTWPVWNDRQRRLRAPLRALLPTVVTFVAFAVVQTAVRARFDHPIREPLEAAGFAVVLVAAVLGSARLLDRRPVSEFGLAFDRSWWHSFAAGALIATAINAGALLVSLWAGWARLVGVTRGAGELPFALAMVVVFGYVAVAATWEEFVMRGVLLKNLAEGADGFLPRWAAVGLAVLCSTLVFAVLHGGKVSHASQYGYYLLAGLVLAGAYVLTGELALSIGFHVFYNVTMSAVFGLGHSQQTPELLAVDIVGPALWVGEEGLVFVGFAALGGLALLGYVRWQRGRLALADSVTRWTPR